MQIERAKNFCFLLLYCVQVSLKNVGEAQCVVAACKALLRKSCSARDIAVITPYKAQQHEIRARLGPGQAGRMVAWYAWSALVIRVLHLEDS